MPYKIFPPPPPVVIKVRGPPKAPKLPLELKDILKEKRLDEYKKREAEALKAGEAIDPFEEEVEEEEDFSECQPEDLAVRKTASFKCLAQITISSSSFLRSVEYNFPQIEDPGLDEILFSQEPEVKRDDEGVDIYLEYCRIYSVVPLRRVLRSFITPIMNLKYYGLRKSHLRCLCEALKTNLYVEFLILEGNFLTPQMIEILVNSLNENKVITDVNLRQCQLGPAGITALMAGVAGAKFVTTLDLSCNGLGVDGGKKLRPIAKMVELQCLNLSNNNLTPECAPALERILLGCGTLINLNLAFNRLGSDEGFDVLFNGLAESDRLEILNLSDNGCCTDPAIFAVFTAYLQATVTLIELDFSRNRIPVEKFIRPLRKALIINKSLKILKIGDNPWLPVDALPLAQVIRLSKTLEVLDMDNIWFTKKIKPIQMKAKLMGRTLIIGGIYQNWEIKGPEWVWLIWMRIKAIFAAPKKPADRQDFGDLLEIAPKMPMKIGEFEQLMLKHKYAALVKDPDLIRHFYDIYTKDYKLQVEEMYADYFRIFPKPEVKTTSVLKFASRSSISSKKTKSSKLSISSKKRGGSKSSQLRISKEEKPAAETAAEDKHLEAIPEQTE
ncbi:unnamed protein product [Phyllotreta striolata]|uniref:Uncharacterized protein n=1 Tax=Phyllotreta striolata TaxID=444603 RepID=A0A9N9XSX9_PHYSR|nr:unnamed protein product [Phyllotreta striolata]